MIEIQSGFAMICVMVSGAVADEGAGVSAIAKEAENRNTRDNMMRIEQSPSGQVSKRFSLHTPTRVLNMKPAPRVLLRGLFRAACKEFHSEIYCYTTPTHRKEEHATFNTSFALRASPERGHGACAGACRQRGTHRSRLGAGRIVASSGARTTSDATPRRGCPLRQSGARHP